jgi:hypothetical protein
MGAMSEMLEQDQLCFGGTYVSAVANGIVELLPGYEMSSSSSSTSSYSSSSGGSSESPLPDESSSTYALSSSNSLLSDTSEALVISGDGMSNLPGEGIIQRSPNGIEILVNPSAPPAPGHAFWRTVYDWGLVDVHWRSGFNSYMVSIYLYSVPSLLGSWLKDSDPENPIGTYSVIGSYTTGSVTVSAG